jgi:hypothetical protein
VETPTAAACGQNNVRCLRHRAGHSRRAIRGRHGDDGQAESAKQSQGCDAHMRFLAGDPKQPTIITATNSGIMYPLARNCGIVPHRRRLAHSMLIASIILEAAVAILAILAARKGKPYVYGLAFTFGTYVLYDLARFLHMDVQEGILSALFLLATISALIAVWGLYKE